MNPISKRIAVAILITVSALGLASGQARLPRLISDGMVLQRNAQAKIWGWAAKGEKITVKFKKSVYRTKANEAGAWNIVLPKMNAGGPYSMEIVASNRITLSDVMVGDVWICSGQSNMELQMSRVSPIYQKEIATSENPNIRQFAVPQRYDFNMPHEDIVAGSWVKADPKSVLDFSAAAYFFARALYERYKVPIGLINASLGGAPAESFMSEQALKEFPDLLKEAEHFKDTTEIVRIETADRNRINAWYQKLQNDDAGCHDSLGVWSQPTIDTSGWSVFSLPGYWADEGLGPVNGVVWFRKSFDVPPSMALKQAKLNLGRIVDADSVFVNGVFVGTTSYQYPPRRYVVPAGLLKERNNVVVVRVINSSGKGGFVPDKQYAVFNDNETVDLSGKWLCRLGAKMDPLASQTFIRWKPLGLYNAMIAPLLNFQIKGVIWYQGESNASRAAQYRTLFPAMIQDWRRHWKEGDFPFLFVQLPNFMEAKPEPSEGWWATLREAQLSALSVRNTGMAVTIDIGEWNDIHPLDKKDVGTRLARAAEKIAYGERGVVCSGPLFRSMKIVGKKVIISFTNIGSGLVARGGELKQFAIAGEDKHFVWAKAKIQKNRVAVWSEKVDHPAAVRYAWADNPEGANLYNKDGLPASPFRTDR